MMRSSLLRRMAIVGLTAALACHAQAGDSTLGKSSLPSPSSLELPDEGYSPALPGLPKLVAGGTSLPDVCFGNFDERSSDRNDEVVASILAAWLERNGSVLTGIASRSSPRSLPIENASGLGNRFAALMSELSTPEVPLVLTVSGTSHHFFERLRVHVLRLVDGESDALFVSWIWMEQGYSATIDVYCVVRSQDDVAMVYQDSGLHVH